MHFIQINLSDLQQKKKKKTQKFVLAENHNQDSFWVAAFSKNADTAVNSKVL